MCSRSKRRLAAWAFAEIKTRKERLHPCEYTIPSLTSSIYAWYAQFPSFVRLIACLGMLDMSPYNNRCNSRVNSCTLPSPRRLSLVIPELSSDKSMSGIFERCTNRLINHTRWCSTIPWKTQSQRLLRAHPTPCGDNRIFPPTSRERILVFKH